MKPHRPTCPGPHSNQPLVDLQARVYQSARAASGPVQSLAGFLLDPRNLSAAWQRVCTAEGHATPGPDGLTTADIAPNADAWLAQLAADLKHERFRASPPRWILVPKTSDPTRPRRLGILNIRDRVVHTALKQVLEPIFEPLFAPGSFGYRPGRSVATALDAAIRLLAGPAHALPFPWALHLDVADCFDSIDHALLLTAIRPHLADPLVLRLLEQILATGARRVGWFWPRTCGLIQGSPLSPLLCNLYLHPLDTALEELRRHRAPRIAALRYADDLLLLAATPAEARSARRRVHKILAQLRLQTRSPQAPPQNVRNGILWLGVLIHPRHTPWDARTTFGYLVPPDKIRQILQTLTELTEPPQSRLDPRAFHLAGWLACLNDQLHAWHQAYQFADNAHELFRAIDHHLARQVPRLLARLARKTPAQIDRLYRRRLPRGFSTWQVDGVQLTVLSAIAPRAQRPSVHRPPWMHSRPSQPPGPPPHPSP